MTSVGAKFFASIVLLSLSACSNKLAHQPQWLPTDAASQTAVQADVMAKLQFRIPEERGELIVQLELARLHFGPSALQLVGEKLRKVRHASAIRLPANIELPYVQIRRIQLLEKRGIYRIVLQDAQGKMQLFAHSEDRAAIDKFINALLTYGRVDPALINSTPVKKKQG